MTLIEVLYVLAGGIGGLLIACACVAAAWLSHERRRAPIVTPSREERDTDWAAAHDILRAADREVAERPRMRPPSSTPTLKGNQ